MENRLKLSAHTSRTYFYHTNRTKGNSKAKKKKKKGYKPQSLQLSPHPSSFPPQSPSASSPHPHNSLHQQHLYQPPTFYSFLPLVFSTPRFVFVLLLVFAVQLIATVSLYSGVALFVGLLEILGPGVTINTVRSICGVTKKDRFIKRVTNFFRFLGGRQGFYSHFRFRGVRFLELILNLCDKRNRRSG
ncbi:hypothetical protein BKA69DRAFT_877995 [Paraphysoderma sedebokerense]|nr:hypothetical protein BKA69DRAFT_877995 [Paraphysoderma sedebokerense]